MKENNSISKLQTQVAIDLEKYNKRIKFIIFLIISLEIGGAVFYHNIEKWSYFDALYFTTATLTTVGYGDITPKTELGRAFTIGYMIMGVGIVLYGLSIISASFIEKREEEFIRMLGGMKVKQPAKNILDKFKSLIGFKNDTTKKTGRSRSK